MTNEQLAILIQQGENDELIPILWERVRKLMNLLSDRYFKAYREKLTSCGISAEDLRSAAYPAFLKAISGFDEGKEYKFTAYLKYPLKNEFRQMLTKDSLNGAESLNSSIDDGEVSERIDLVADETSLDFVERVDRDSLCEAVRAAVNRLSPEKQDYIRRRFYNGDTLSEIAQSEGKSYQAVQQYEKKLLNQLQRNRDFAKLKNELGYDSYRTYHDSFSGFKHRGISSVESIAIRRADIYLKLGNNG